jgi:hypothetical protein
LPNNGEINQTDQSHLGKIDTKSLIDIYKEIKIWSTLLAELDFLNSEDFYRGTHRHKPVGACNL